MPKIELTKSQILNLIDFFECDFIGCYKNNTEADNIAYLVDMCDIYTKLKKAQENDNAE